MIDDCWMDNVGPLISALEKLGVDPVEWACDPDHAVFCIPAGKVHDPILKNACNYLSDLRPLLREMGSYDQVMCNINFACGYLQATGNLTGQTWAEQIADALAEEKEVK